MGRMRGYLASDDDRFGGNLLAANQTFAVATSPVGDFASSPVEGVLGLAPSMGYNEVLGPIFRVLSQLDKRIFTVFLERHTNLSEGGVTGGQITYGALDTENCDAQVDYVPMNTELGTYWQFQLDSTSVGGAVFDEPRQAFLDTSTWGVGLPTEQFDALVCKTGAVKSGDNYIVDCNDAARLPDLCSASAGSRTPYRALAMSLMWALGRTSASLLILVRASETYPPGSPPEYPTVVFGSTFMETYCTVHEFGNWRVGFTKAIHDDTPVCK